MPTRCKSGGRRARIALTTARVACWSNWVCGSGWVTSRRCAASVRSSGTRTPLPFQADGQDLGWLAPNHRIAAAWRAAQQRGIDIRCGQVVTRLPARGRGRSRADALRPASRGVAGRRRRQPLLAAETPRWHRCPPPRLRPQRAAGAMSTSAKAWRRCFLQGHTLALLPKTWCRSSAVDCGERPVAADRGDGLPDAALAGAIEAAAEGWAPCAS